jgi:alanyl-tRNA synthetase
MDRKELIKNYIEFFKSKGHSEIRNSSLVPENDSTVLFTTAGMHPIVPFLLGEKHPQGKRLCNVQKCIRTGDIDDVGDTFHHTFFEMLGNWSLGGYWKEEAILMTFEFHTKILGISKDRYAVTVFGGDKRVEEIPKDTESAEVWRSLGIPKERIVFLKGGVLESDNNWWGPAGKTGPCGPCTEQFYWKLKGKSAPKVFNPDDKNWVEIGNDVLMQYIKDKDEKYNLAKQKNIDFGGGVERTVAVLNGLEDNYLADMWKPIIETIEHLSNKSYEENKRTMRIIADHIKAAVFIIGDGVVPSNTEQGYVLRRLIRRAIINLRKLGFVGIGLINPIAEKVFEIYDDYEYLQENKEKIYKEIEKEEDKFDKTLEKGLNLFNKITKDKKSINGKNTFLLFQSYGFPIEMIKEMAGEKNIKVDEESFISELKKHQELSRTASAGKFKSGLADNSEATTKLHTATHLLNQALRVILKNPDIYQRGSNITSEKLRFDFNFDRKITKEEIEKIENLVNEKINEKIPVVVEEMSVEEAKKRGAQGIFESKYGEKVKVYFIGKFSREICAGPHVSNTKELGKFKIVKEESSSAGVRRIKAILE